jgi:hypothetical protein
MCNKYIKKHILLNALKIERRILIRKNPSGKHNRHFSARSIYHIISFVMVEEYREEF